tara:strand:- start:419 stop:715 length:297 start_codon:yes stop_codon:yes gene_type:complete
MSKISDYLIDNDIELDDEHLLTERFGAELTTLKFEQAQYQYTIDRADKGFQYEWADEEKSVEGKVFWMLKNPEGKFICYVHKHNGTVHYTLHGQVKIK